MRRLAAIYDVTPENMYCVERKKQENAYCKKREQNNKRYRVKGEKLKVLYMKGKKQKKSV